MEEFEIKYLDINILELEKKLIQIGAEKIGLYDYHRINFDYPDLRLDTNHGWLRVRTDGKKTTLTYKERMGVRSNDASVPDKGMKEIEIKVDDFEKTCEIFRSVGLITKLEVRNQRIRYEKGDVVYDLDTYINIPPYIEIESTSLEKAKVAAKELGFDPEQALICSATQIYKKYGYNLLEYRYIGPDGMIKN